MRIISKFRDYYDSGLAYGHDDNTVYVRHTLEYPLKPVRTPSGWKTPPATPTVITELVERIQRLAPIDTERDWDWYMRTQTNRLIGSFVSGKDNFSFNTFGVVFCGKYYPGIRVEQTKLNTGVPRQVEHTDWFYDADDLIAFMLARGCDAEKERTGRRDNAADGIRLYFDVKQPDVDWLVANKVISVVYERYSDTVLVNPPLKNYGFFKAVDHYTAFQELDVWISGTLAYPQNAMVELDDKYRVMAHGFDLKYGFRTRPKENK